MAASVFISVAIQSAKRTPRNDEQKNDDRNKRHRAAWASDACASGHLLMSRQLQASGNITVETLIAQPTSNLGRQWRKPWSESRCAAPRSSRRLDFTSRSGDCSAATLASTQEFGVGILVDRVQRLVANYPASPDGAAERLVHQAPTMRHASAGMTACIRIPM